MIKITPTQKLTIHDKAMIRKLYVAELLGTASKEEQSQLYSNMNNPTVKKVCKEVGLLFNNPATRPLLMLDPNSPELAKMTQDLLKLKDQDKIDTWFYWVLAGFILLGLAFLWFFFSWAGTSVKVYPN